jgi:hypothetical protein
MIGWAAVATGFVAFWMAARGAVTETEDSGIETPWYVPKGTEEWMEEKASEIQQEQKQRVESALSRAFGQGLVAMTAVGVVFGAIAAGRRPPRRSTR